MSYSHACLVLALSLALVCAGCGGDDSRGGGGSPTGAAGEAGAGPVEPPERTEGGLPCVISADCPAGLHCDLGECIQDCSAEDPCGEEQVCSARARCLEEDEADTDPAPQTEFIATVEVAPTNALLTDADSNLLLTLTTDSNEPVSYRVQVNAPHLSIEQPRGEFRGSAAIELDVDPSVVRGRDVGGNVRIFTSLGTVLVSTPLHAGLTGRYHGSLRYASDLVELGEARLALQMTDEGGDVSVEVDTDESLLFPDTGSGPTSGYGSYRAGETIHLTLYQRIDRDFGGERNHFGPRDLGRRVDLYLDPDGKGNLQGRFEDTVVGVLETNVVLTGDVWLEYQPDESDRPITPGFVELPALPNIDDGYQEASEVFADWTGSCADYVAQAQTYNEHALPLAQAVSAAAEPFDSIAADCKTALEGQALEPTDLCGNVPPLACAVNETAAGAADDSLNVYQYGLFMQGLAAPAAFVAQEEMVQALTTSLTGSGTEMQHYDSALAALAPVATWMLQPRVLSFMRDASDEMLAEPPGVGDTDSTQNDSYPALRALAKVLRLLADVDGERARVAALGAAASHAEELAEAQSRALLTFLEASALYGVLDGRSAAAPANVVCTYSGILSPLDAGFGALVDGPLAFGVPEGHVPFMYRDDDPGNAATNFEQTLAAAERTIENQTAIEAEFTARSREFDTNQQALADERLRLAEQYDSRLADLCGDDFRPDEISSPSDWESCGQSDGTIASLRLSLQQAHAALRSAESRMCAMKEKIEIDERALAEAHDVRAETLQFVSDTGEELQALTMAEGTLNAISAAVQTASSSSLWNAGAPAAMAGVVYATELARTGLNVRREQLHTAQTMRFEEANAEIELINGMTNIQRQVIDLEQLGVESCENVLAILQAELDIQNALNEAKRIYDDRAARQALADRNPLGDPAFRIVRDRVALQLLGSRARAQRDLYLAGRALEYEINRELPGIAGAVSNARNALGMTSLASCFEQIFTSAGRVYTDPQDYVTTVSVREMLGITGPRVDAVTGEELSEGEQFRLYVLRNENLDPDDSVSITFCTNLQPGNELWSSGVCNDRITNVQAQLVGDFQGDNEAEVQVVMSGAAVMRACDTEELRTWALGDGTAVIQAGVNSFGEASPNTSLFGQSVARATWVVTIMGANAAPANADINLDSLEDVVLRIGHEASPQQSSAETIDISCLAELR